MARKFSEVFNDQGGVDFVSGDEKEDLIATGAEFPALRVYKAVGGQWGDKFNLVTVLPDDPDTERVLSFGTGSVHSRDRQLDALMNFIEEEGDEYQPVQFKLTRVKQSLVLVNLEDTE